MKNIRKGLALILAAVFLMAGCDGSAGQKSPELQEPVSRNSACRPVETGRIGDIEVRMATVVPVEYGHFYGTDVMIEEIRVEVGDYVRKGDILAKADTREARDRKKELERELSREEKKYELQTKISQQKEQEIKLSGGRDRKRQLAVLREEESYERYLYEQQVQDIRQGIRESEKEIQEGTLRARHAGYVTFRKNLSHGTLAGPSENIVVVEDREQLYIELDEMNTNDYPYQDYEVKYIISGGKEYPVKEIPYRESELALAVKLKEYPLVRLTCPKKAGLAQGDSCLVYYCKKDISGVLTVGNDSLHKQGEEYYVYVRNDTGEEEKRSITIGRQDSFQTEVRAGLKKGEIVCYSSHTALPGDYGTYTAERTEYEVGSRIGALETADAVPYIYTSEIEGSIVESMISEGDRIKKGELLYIVDTGKGKAFLTDLAYQLQKEKDAFRNGQKERRKQAALELKGKKGSLRRAVRKRQQYEEELAAYEHSCTLRQIEQEQAAAKKGNDGSGMVRVYAEYSGTVSGCQVTVGEAVSVGAQMFVVKRKDKTGLRISQVPPIGGQPPVEKAIANVGETITFSTGGETFTGRCTGIALNSDGTARSYLCTVDGKSYLCKNTNPEFKYPGYYVELEDEKLYSHVSAKTQVTFAYVHFRDVVTVPVDCIHQELSGENKDEHFVWRVVEGELVKQYVTYNEELNDGANQVIFSGVKPGDVVAR